MCKVCTARISTRRYERIFDFGNRTGPAQTDVATTFYLSPNFDPDRGVRLHFRGTDGEDTRLILSSGFPSGALAHVAVVLDSDEHTMTP